MVERGGRVPAYMTPREGALETVSLHVDPKATDEWAGYGNIKNGIAGNYGVSVKWLQSYVNEYVWRYNHHSDRRTTFGALLQRAVEVEPECRDAI
jgi:hypothetical protein